MDRDSRAAGLRYGEGHAVPVRTPGGAVVRGRWAHDAQEKAGRVLVDGITGEVITERVEYREGKTVVLLPWGVLPSDIPPSACRNDFLQICRAFLQSVREVMAERKLSVGARLLWLDTLIDADPVSGSVTTTTSEVVRRYGCARATAYAWMRILEEFGLVHLETTGVGRGSETVITIVHYAEVVRLDLERRIAIGAQEARLKRRITERITTIDRVVEEFE